MDPAEREHVRRLAAEVKQWSQQASDVQTWHHAVQNAAASAERALRLRTIGIARAGEVAWQVVPLDPGDTAAVARLAQRANLPVPAAADQNMLRLLTEDLRRAVTDAGAMFGLRRFFTGAKGNSRRGPPPTF